MIQLSRCCVLCCLSVLYCCFANAQPNITKVEYYIDNDPGYGNATNKTITPGKNLTDQSININPILLSYGVHLVGVRAKDANGHWSLDNKWLLVKPQLTVAVPKVSAVEYYIDTDPGYGNAMPVAVTGATNIADKTFAVNPSALSSGVHLIGIRARDANGHWSLDNKWLFVKPQAAAALANINRAEYYIDTDPGYGNATAVGITAGTNISDKAFNINPATLSAGVHLVGIRARDAVGHWSLDNKWLFVKPAGAVNVPKLKLVEYYIDTDPGYGNAKAIPVAADTNASNISININPTTLSTGAHLLGIRAKDASGHWSLDNKWLFINPAAQDTVLPNLKQVEYYIDTDPGWGKGIPIAISNTNKQVNFQLPVNISGLDTGSHKLFIRSKDVNNAWSLDNVFTFKVAVKIATPSIITTSIVNKNLCIGDVVKVSYAATGTYNSGNIFKVQLSNAAGSFVAPTVIGTHAGADNSIINCALPANLPYGNRYRIRVVSTSPALTGITGSDTLIIHAKSSPAPTVTPAGDTVICNGSSILLSAGTGYLSYYWNSGQNTRQIRVDTTGSYRVTVTDTTGCQGTSAPANVSLKNKPVLSNITGPATVLAGQDSLLYKVTDATGVTYTWTVPAGATITAGQGTEAITVTWGSGSGQVTVKGTNNCGTSGVKSLAVTVAGALIAMDKKQMNTDKSVKLYPNPAANTTVLAFYFDKEEGYAIELTDMAGKVLQHISGSSAAGRNTVKLDFSRYAQGIYWIILRSKAHGICTLKFSKE